jgi:hypothetical protein
MAPLSPAALRRVRRTVGRSLRPTVKPLRVELAALGRALTVYRSAARSHRDAQREFHAAFHDQDQVHLAILKEVARVERLARSRASGRGQPLATCCKRLAKLPAGAAALPVQLRALLRLARQPGSASLMVAAVAKLRALAAQLTAARKTVRARGRSLARTRYDVDLWARKLREAFEAARRASEALAKQLQVVNPLLGAAGRRKLAA